jgi:cytochrome c553
MAWRFILLPLLALLTGGLLAPPAALAGDDEPFTQARLQELLQKNPATGLPVDSIGELVPLLPRELRENFTFVYDSRSPFRSGISPEFPRVIMFTNDARLVLTFIGDERQPGFDLLETVWFDYESATFELHAYLLPAAERRSWRPSAEEAKCARCHGADARPIFDSYPLWPGYYGSVQDTFPHDRIGQKEAKNYAAFAAGAAKTGIYKDLINPAGSPVSPFLDPSLFDDDTVELDPKVFPYLPNARLGIALTELNRQRIYRKLAAGEGFAANEKQLLAKLLECRPGDRPDRNAMRSIAEELRKENADRLKRLGVLPGDPPKSRDDMQELEFVRELAQIDWVAKRAGVDRSDWSMAMEPGSLAFFDGILSGISNGRSYYLKEDLIFELLSHLRDRERAFRKFFVWGNVFEDYGYPFGHRLNLGAAAKSCALLGGSQRSSGS